MDRNYAIRLASGPRLMQNDLTLYRMPDERPLGIGFGNLVVLTWVLGLNGIAIYTARTPAYQNFNGEPPPMDCTDQDLLAIRAALQQALQLKCNDRDLRPGGNVSVMMAGGGAQVDVKNWQR